MSVFTKEQKDYQNFVKQKRPKPPILKNVIAAFAVGGTICAIGQVILNFFVSRGMTPEQAGAPTSISMIFLGALLTGLGVYDKIGKFAGAGSVVPITGFANSIVSPAMEFKREGYVFGVAAKMFAVAGPVLVYGINSATIIGLIYYLIRL
ncbi:stage V sporulation protein AC [Tepidanaerobacter acetatoxydans Re1]|uniref:Stage V sporulation protein AC n=1 Tax=Tepidanaerobacter acetatoxydans (strain DSM 21804 / JCM 16047 / Re1) TaxID=1209989 RepID=F4LUZ4_TEPAE|nr:stage V sporulation protein AC [Tepidanaerobacter acetatoxydans]AEE91520.1 stage V sporulation protein AC [Tepidanaerobacter acetatoxydans Re1]CCP26236.1 stage V sporulation protein AC [Tepidanaerobacter acetatoxydans Re1]